MSLIKVAAGLASLMLMSTLAPDIVEARIQCQGNFQVTKYGLISTPYCEEQQIARVARRYGVQVTDEQVRNDPLTKVDLCLRLGGDVRLKGSCGAYSPDLFRR
jgi:hypothetical protein